MQVSFTLDAGFRLSDLLSLQLHQYAEDVGEIVDRAQKEEKMEGVSWAAPACCTACRLGGREVDGALARADAADCM